VLGYDTSYKKGYEDDEILEDAKKEQRIILTRDEELILRGKKSNLEAYNIKGKTIEQRLVHLNELLAIPLVFPKDEALRCTKCNSPLQKVEKNAIKEHLLQGTKENYDEFWQCSNDSCKQIYWKGPHWENMAKTLEKCQLLIGKRKGKVKEEKI
jgi:hypothetical protein